MRFRGRGRVVSPYVNLRGVVSSGIAVAAVAALIVAGPAGAADAGKRIDLRVLVLTDGTPGVDAVSAQLEREGVPYDSIDTRVAGRPTVTPALLTAAADHGRYQGVVVPNENPLPAAEATALADYERGFGVRRLVAYTWAGPHAGQTTAWSGPLDGGSLTVTAAGKAAGFGYLAGAIPIDDRDPNVPESFATLGTAGAGFTPLIAGQANGGGAGSVAGVYTVDGREQLIVTTALNRFLTHGLVLGHGLVTWLTRGVNLGYWRNFFSLHVDDVLLPDDRWHTGGNCTVGADCPSDLTAPEIRMLPADVDTLVAWQQRTGLKLDVAYNAFGAKATDPLTTRLLARKADLRWLNHTWSHLNLGSVPAADITAEITKNVDWARANGVTIDKQELVTGEHSGLRSLPELPNDNPNLGPALQAAGITSVASDASREEFSRVIGPARTVPRHPMNIYYNTGKVAEAVDEYNWIYTSRANGGSGICETNPASTCITPLGANGFTSHIVPTEVRIAFDHIAAADPRPHYAHQSNITEDKVLYPVLDALLTKYKAVYASNTGLVNPRMSAVGQLFARQDAWRKAVAARTVTGYRIGDTVTIVNTGAAAIDSPLTAPTGTRKVSLNLLGVGVPGDAYGEAYGGQRSAWQSLARNKPVSVKLPA